MKAFLKETEPNIFSLWDKDKIRIETPYDLSGIIQTIKKRRAGIYSEYDIKKAINFGALLEAGMLTHDFKKYSSYLEHFQDIWKNAKEWEVVITDEKVGFE